MVCPYYKKGKICKLQLRYFRTRERAISCFKWHEKGDYCCSRYESCHVYREYISEEETQKRKEENWIV